MIYLLKLNAVSSEEKFSKQDVFFKKLVRFGVLAILALIILFLIVRIFPNYHLFLTAIFKIILPFALALLLAYLLKPIVDKLTCRWIPSWLAILIIYFVFIIGVSLLLYFTYPVFRVQVLRFFNQLPALLDEYREWINQLDQMIQILPEPIHGEIDVLFNRISVSSAIWLENKVISLGAISDYFISLAVVPVVLYYFLLDQSKMRMKFVNWIPKRYQKKSKQLIAHLNKNLGHYIRSQLLISLFIGVTTYIVYLVLRIDFAFILALFMTVMNIIPYFGPLIGAFPAVIIALTTSTSTALYLIIAVIVIQVLENNLLAPFIMSYNLRVHPVLVIFVLLIGSEFGGIIGMILAVPVLVVIRSVMTHNPLQKS